MPKKQQDIIVDAINFVIWGGVALVGLIFAIIVLPLTAALLCAGAMAIACDHFKVREGITSLLVIVAFLATLFLILPHWGSTYMGDGESCHSIRTC